jgi:SAM-dependent methyltransferase
MDMEELLTPWFRSHPGTTNPGTTVLELGCGPGRDAMALAEMGCRVVACDRSPTAFAECDATAVLMVRVDHSRRLPFRDGCFDVVLAALSLHYLPWDQTLSTFGEVRRVLRRDGLLLFRVNASDDVNFGSNDGVEVTPGFRRYEHETHGGGYKRFFKEEDVRDALPAGFVIEHLQHIEIRRWNRPKQAWECRARAV